MSKRNSKVSPSSSTPRPTASTTKIRLNDIVSSISASFVESKSSLDKLSAEMAKEYSKDYMLSVLPLPFFSISNVHIQLKFAVKEIQNNEIDVIIDTPSLEKLAPQAVSQVDFDINLQPVRALKKQDGSTILSSGD